MAPALESTDLKNKLEDLSGVVLKPGENPYNALIEVCDDDPVELFLPTCPKYLLFLCAQKLTRMPDENTVHIFCSPR